MLKREPKRSDPPWTVYACPACGQSAYYAKTLDRYVHVDGSANRLCWVYVTAGVVDPWEIWVRNRTTRMRLVSGHG